MKYELIIHGPCGGNGKYAHGVRIFIIDREIEVILVQITANSLSNAMRLAGAALDDFLFNEKNAPKN